MPRLPAVQLSEPVEKPLLVETLLALLVTASATDHPQSIAAISPCNCVRNTASEAVENVRSVSRPCAVIDCASSQLLPSFGKFATIQSRAASSALRIATNSAAM